MNRAHSLIGAFGLVAALFVGAACSNDDVANDALKNTGVNVNTSGGLPSGFPSEVVTPKLNLETGVGAVGTFTLRYTTKDPKTDTLAYRDAMKAAGFTIAGETDNLENAANGGNITFTATNAKYIVAVSAFSASAPGGGNYMGVVVTPAS